MITKIKFFKRNVYGNTQIYLTGEGAEQINRLTKKKTVDEYDLKALQELGIELEQVIDPKALL